MPFCFSHKNNIIIVLVFPCFLKINNFLLMTENRVLSAPGGLMTSDSNAQLTAETYACFNSHDTTGIQFEYCFDPNVIIN